MEDKTARSESTPHSAPSTHHVEEEPFFEPIPPISIVLMGASGDLSKRMVVPAIFRLFRRGILPGTFRLVGYAREPWTEEHFREVMREAVLRDARPGDAEAWPEFAAAMTYVPPELAGDDAKGYEWLAAELSRHDSAAGAGGRRLFYLAIPPAAMRPVLDRLSDMKLAGHGYEPPEGGWARVIVEKPFGRSLESACELDREIASSISERDVFRIDHFLGKEAVQNLFAFRFGNGIFEPVWNRNYIDNVQITAAETLGIEGRGTFYESSGALRDMVQSHLLQVLALVALEPPGQWLADSVRDEKAQVLTSVRPIKREQIDEVAVRGQYGPGTVGGKAVPGYREEPNVAPDSCVETYAAVKLFIDNWRWAGVPFYLRSGKRLSTRVTEVHVTFKPAPHSIFSLRGEPSNLRPNTLTVRVTPDDALFLDLEGKRPGHGMNLRPVQLDYISLQDDTPSAYEYLLLDAIRGSSLLFARSDEVEAAWQIVQPILDAWEGCGTDEFPNYAAGSDGPATADALLARDGRRWKPLKH
jgi:glucose-6-phosphate 1-dehydrogenase